MEKEIPVAILAGDLAREIHAIYNGSLLQAQDVYNLLINRIEDIRGSKVKE